MLNRDPAKYRQTSEDDDSQDSEQDSWLPLRWRTRCLVVLGLLAVAGLSLALLQPIGRHIAGRVAANSRVVFETIDLGHLNGSSSRLRPHVRGRVQSWSPMSGTAALMDASVHVSMPGGALARVGSVEVPVLAFRAFQWIALDMQATFDVEDLQDLGQAGRAFVTASEVSWLLKGRIDITCWLLGFVPLRFKDVPIEKSIVLQGMSGFSQEANPVTLKQLERVVGEEDCLHLAAAISLSNPSFLSLEIASNLNFVVYQRGKRFGLARTSKLLLVPGHNVVNVEFRLEQTPENKDAIQEFTSGYIQAQTQYLTVLGLAESADSFLAAVLRNLSVAIHFQPPPADFIEEPLVATIGLTGLSANARIFNPLPQAITLGHLDLKIYLPGSERREIFDLDTRQSNTFIPGSVLQPQQVTSLHIGLSVLGARLTNVFELQKLIASLEQGDITVAVEGWVGLTISPSFQTTVDYRSDSMTAKLHWCVICT